jgi:hypothetical protein
MITARHSRLYGVYLIYLGLPILMKAPREAGAGTPPRCSAACW